MIIENKLTKRKYRNLVLSELLFGNIRTIIMLVLYCLGWRILYSVAKVGQLKRNVPLFLGISFILLAILINIGITCHVHMRNSFFYNTASIMVDNDELVIDTDEYNHKIRYPWNSLTKVKENRKWYFLFFNDKSFFPISKDKSGELRDYLEAFRSVRRTYKKLSILALVLVTAWGIYYVGTCAVNFNGDLAWKINELKTDKKARLEDMNLYTMKLQGIINILKNKEKTEPNLMTNSLDIKFKKDGTIISFETYIYGFDNNYNLKSGYLLYYDRSKSTKVTIHKQDWGSKGTTKYNSENDLSIVINMLNKIPVKDEVKGWNESTFAIMYKGIRDWGYNLDGIRFIDKNGNIIIPQIPKVNIKGPTISIYCPGREQTITPHRFVYIPGFQAY